MVIWLGLLFIEPDVLKSQSLGSRLQALVITASVESVRLEPELREALLRRAERDHETPSSVLRKALRNYLQVG
jgi:hypothetical protein